MQLLILTPCDRVLMDAEQGHSLISVFHGLKVGVPADQEIPRDAMIPKDWCIFSKHLINKKEEGFIYSAVLEVLWPDGTVFGRLELSTKDKAMDSLAFGFKFQGFPIGQNGRLKITETVFREGVQVFGPSETSIDVSVSVSLALGSVPPAE